ncbi:hypothetical protein IQ07DRAFT_590482 [Pyrenochaeta sp. DS3sAY3a]|nr:hypothetical protein IQ07DRAFT_590482 [Pyrenochaeta sp. DS3sAY3a]
MFIICPLSQCASPEKRDRFLSYIEKIAPVTFNTEPNCHAYAWFRSADDNDVVPSHWLRGFEIYTSVEANQVEHRASPEYKDFRTAAGEEKLLSKPSDLRFWRPGGIGFLTKGAPAVFGPVESSSRLQYLVTEEINPRNGERSKIFELFRRIVANAEQDDATLTLWVQDRIGTPDTRPEKIEDESLFVLLRFEDRNGADAFYSQTKSEWAKIRELSEHNRRTTWVESGIGFIGR